jgi:riboflavin synthase alpha subunit
METQKIFCLDMIKGNKISHTKKAEITINGTTVTIIQLNDEPADVWVSTPTNYTRVAENMEISEAVNLGNILLINLKN